MDQGVPGCQNEPFYELLHPTSSDATNSHLDAPAAFPPLAPSSPPPTVDKHLSPSSSPLPASQNFYGNDDADGSVIPNYDFISSKRSGDMGFRSDERLSASNYRVAPAQIQLASSAKDEPGPLDMTNMEHTIKKCTGNIVQLLEGMSGKLSQLETTVQGLESAVEELKLGGVERHSQTNGRLTRLEFLIKEVQGGVQLLHVKDSTTDIRSQGTIQQVSTDQGHVAGVMQTTGLDQWQKLKEEGSHNPMPLQPLPLHMAPQPQPQPHPQPQPQPQPQLPPPPPHHLHSVPSHHSQVPSQTAPQQQLLSPQLSAKEPIVNQYNQQAPPHHVSPQPNLGLPHDIQAPLFYSAPPPPPPSSYNSAMQYAPRPFPPSSTYVPDPPQYFEEPRGPQPLQMSHENTASGYHQVHEHVGSRTGKVPPSVHWPPQCTPVSNVYDTSSIAYGPSAYRAAQPVAPSAPSGAGGYPRLPMAQPLPHALPTSIGPSGGPVPTGSRGVDEVIDKVANMGFPKEHVRTVVRQLTENGQSVDLNIVLDKLMNGGEFPPPRGLFGRA